MNPAFGLWPADAEPEPRHHGPTRLTLREVGLLVRSPHPRPPASPALWLAWANGEPTPGPRWERVLDVEARARVAEARVLRSVPPPVPTLSPWAPDGLGWSRYWLGPCGGRLRRAAHVRFAGRHYLGGERWSCRICGGCWDYLRSREEAMREADGLLTVGGGG